MGQLHEHACCCQSPFLNAPCAMACSTSSLEAAVDCMLEEVVLAAMSCPTPKRKQPEAALAQGASEQERQSTTDEGDKAAVSAGGGCTCCPAAGG